MWTLPVKDQDFTQVGLFARAIVAGAFVALLAADDAKLQAIRSRDQIGALVIVVGCWAFRIRKVCLYREVGPIRIPDPTKLRREGVEVCSLSIGIGKSLCAPRSEILKRAEEIATFAAANNLDELRLTSNS